MTTPVPPWPTPTPFPEATPLYNVEIEFEIGQDWAYSAINAWQMGTQNNWGFTFIQYAILLLIVWRGFRMVIRMVNRL